MTTQPNAIPLAKMSDVNAHTPGPWIAERTRLDGVEWFVNSESRNLPPYRWLPRLRVKLEPLQPVSGKLVEAHSGTASSDAGRCDIAIIESAANAHLIAAAPDMLAALQAVIAEWQDGYGLKCVDQCRAAIARAATPAEAI